MGGNLMESRAELSFRIHGDSEVDANLLADILSNVAELTQEISRDQDPQNYAKMNVKAFNEGSFEVCFSAIAVAAATLIANPDYAIHFASYIMKLLVQCFELKKHLQGQRPARTEDRQDGNRYYFNNDGNVYIGDRGANVACTNIRVDELASGIAQRLSEHNPSVGFTLGTGNENAVFEPNDIVEIAKQFPVDGVPAPVTATHNGDLIICSANFSGRAKWQFDSGNRKFWATIDDDDFLDAFSDGQYPLKPNDYINADFQVTTEFDGTGMAQHKTARYIITKVHNGVQHDARHKQLKFADFD
ncbi:MAG: hypothetical protein FWE40_02140 [Oscillospiraceae bacterium]|nr:hypothetical protein [Oscillospiraceae bacterium]